MANRSTTSLKLDAEIKARLQQLAQFGAEES
jgi:predicted transcriptional regulator